MTRTVELLKPLTTNSPCFSTVKRRESSSAV